MITSPLTSERWFAKPRKARPADGDGSAGAGGASGRRVGARACVLDDDDDDEARGSMLNPMRYFRSGALDVSVAAGAHLDRWFERLYKAAPSFSITRPLFMATLRECLVDVFAASRSNRSIAGDKDERRRLAAMTG